MSTDPTSAEYICPTCSRSFKSEEALNSHVSDPGKRHDKLKSEQKATACPTCNRKFVSEQAMLSHHANPGKQHGGVPSGKKPCKCGVENWKLLEYKTRRGGFVFKMTFRCNSCSRRRITVPLSEDTPTATRAEGEDLGDIVVVKVSDYQPEMTI